MAIYDIYYFMITRPRPPQIGSSGPAPVGVALEQNPQFQDFVTRYTNRLRDLFERSIPQHPGYVAPPGEDEPPNPDYVPWTVNIHRIPEASPGVPNFTGLTIAERDPIVYLCRNNHDATNVARRRASFAMLRQLEDDRWQGIDQDLIRDRRTAYTTPGDILGMAVIPMENTTLTDQYQYCPLVAEVFTNLTPVNAQPVYGTLTLPQMRSAWAEIMSELLARASFHEIAHCKAQSYNRPTGSAWITTRPDSIHTAGTNGICAASVTYQTAPIAADFQVMGEHMMFPGPFYKLDQPISQGSGASAVTQCRSTGQPHALTPAPPPPPDSLDADPLDDI